MLPLHGVRIRVVPQRPVDRVVVVVPTGTSETPNGVPVAVLAETEHLDGTATTLVCDNLAGVLEPSPTIGRCGLHGSCEEQSNKGREKSYFDPHAYVPSGAGLPFAYDASP